MMNLNKTLTVLITLALLLTLTLPCAADPDSVTLVDGRLIINCAGSGSVSDDGDFDVISELVNQTPSAWTANRPMIIETICFVGDTVGDTLVLETADDAFVDIPMTITTADQPICGRKIHRQVNALYIDEMSAGTIAILTVK